MTELFFPQVCGLDSEPVKGELQEADLLQRHIEKINSISVHYRNAPKIFIPEVNYGMPDHLPNMVVGMSGPYMDNIYIFHDPKKNKPGVYKTQQTSEYYRFSTSQALFHEAIRFDEGLFTSSKGLDDTLTVEKILHMLQNQLERYHYISKDPVDAFGTERKKLSGKTGGQNDDLIIVFMMAIAWGRICLKDPRVREAIQRRGGGSRFVNVGFGSHSFQAQ